MNIELLKRIWHSFRLCLILSSANRAEYIRKHQLFHNLGTGCTIMNRKIPLCAKLISIGNNVHLASGVSLTCHDAIHLCLNNTPPPTADHQKARFQEKIGCIEIGDNVFIGENTTILYDTKIGSKVIVGARTLVNKDIPDNSVAVGIPARVIGTFDDFFAKRRKQTYPEELFPINHAIPEQLEHWCWNDFTHRRK